MNGKGWMRLLAAVGSLAAAGAAVAAEPYEGGAVAPATARPVVSDDVIVAQIQAKLADNKLLRHTQVVVASSNGEVTLTGTIPSSFARDQIMEAVQSTAGVVRYNDQMRLNIASPEAPTRN